MSKSKNKNRNELEYYKGLVRQLRARLKYYRKREHLIEENFDEEDFEYIEDDVMEFDCPQCNQGNLVETDLHHIIIRKCDNARCEYTEKINKK